MPGIGLVKARNYSAAELASMEAGEEDLEVATGFIREQWGMDTLDIYLNNETYWENVPKQVWEFYLGGCQVLKKWLSYREISVLGRGMTKEEVREFTQIVRRIAMLLILQPTLDANYSAIIADPYDWAASLARQ